MQKFTSKIVQLDSTVWSICLIVPVENAAPFLGGKDRRILCTLNDEIQIYAALMPKGEGIWFVNINKETRKKLNLEVGSSVDVILEKDESKYGMPMPEEFDAILESDTAGNEIFHQLTPGKQRTLIYQIGKPKSSDKRITKGLKILEYLKMTNGKIDFKELNEWMKTK